MRLASAVMVLVLAGCTGVPAKAVRDWASPNFKQVVSLVDEKYTADETRLQSYKSLAALICEADIADRKAQGDSLACQCHHATSDDALKARCTDFVQQYR